MIERSWRGIAAVPVAAVLASVGMAMGPGGGGGGPKITDCNNNSVEDATDIQNGTSRDCNANGIPDECDIADATSADTNSDGVPDECQFSGCVSAEHIFAFEDTQGTFVASGASQSQMNLTVNEAVNALIAQYGDNFDFVNVWTTTPNVSGCGCAAYHTTIMNDVQGTGRGTFDLHNDYGILGSRLRAYNIQFDIERINSDPLSASGITFHETGHYWGVYTTALDDGRVINGNGTTCGQAGPHWGQQFNSGQTATGGTGGRVFNSSTGCWEGSSAGNNENQFGGKFYSTVELYLMGYLSPAEVDALRPASMRQYLDDGLSGSCANPYCGTTTQWSIQNFINVAGPRVPDETQSQKDFRMAWIVIYQPGSPPTPEQFNAYAAGANQWILDWSQSTLGRGTMDCQIFPDSNCDGLPDFDDCNGNYVDDSADISGGTSLDCNTNGVPDECELAQGVMFDCNSNGALDVCDISTGVSQDCDANGVPDECEPDCNSNGIPDACDISAGTSLDCNANGVPDSCDLANGAADNNSNGIPDECEGIMNDCNMNGIDDAQDISTGTSQDCNSDGIPDECQAPADCNTNGVWDLCDISNGTSEDCQFNGIPDECENDCNCNGIIDSIDIDPHFGTSTDCNANGIPDECEKGNPCGGGGGGGGGGPNGLVTSSHSVTNDNISNIVTCTEQHLSSVMHLRSDVNNDGAVDYVDIIEFMSTWSHGSRDTNDLLEFLDWWMQEE